jgi:hypothetical protein
MITIIISVAVCLLVYFSVARQRVIFHSKGRSWRQFNLLKYCNGRFRKDSLRYNIFQDIKKIVSGEKTFAKIGKYTIVYRSNELWTNFDIRIGNKRRPKDYRHRIFVGRFGVGMFVTIQPLNAVIILADYIEKGGSNI